MNSVIKHLKSFGHRIRYGHRENQAAHADLYQRIDELRGTIDEIRGTIDDAREAIAEIHGMNHEVRGTIIEMRGTIDQLTHPYGRVRQVVDEAIAHSVRLTDGNGHPIITPLSEKLRDLESMSLTIKYFGYDLARRLADILPARVGLRPTIVNLKSKVSTQEDLESDWAAYWLSELKIPMIFHRKLWEFTYLLQALYDHGLFREGARGLGFGCGEEPIPSYLASKGINVTVTDLAPEEMASKGWAATSQHTASIDMAFKPHLVDRTIFDKLVSHRFADMNAIPSDLVDYDFCWSICAFEHLGSIAKGLDFIENSMKTLRSGGLSVHTTEFNFNRDDQTIDNWGTVLFQRRHFHEIADRLRTRGHHVAELDFHLGDKPLDKFIDVPPFVYDWRPAIKQAWSDHAAGLKLSIDGFQSTCFGLIVKKG